MDICNIVQGDVSAEVIATDYEGMIKEGEDRRAQSAYCGESALYRGRHKAIKYFSGRHSVPTARWCFP